MEQPQKFRSAFNGFNRDDVVHYLEFLNHKHAAQVSQLENEADSMRRRLDSVNTEIVAEVQIQCSQLEGQLEDANRQNALLQQENEQLRQQLVQLQQQLMAAQAELQNAGDVLQRTTAERDSARQQHVVIQSQAAAQELEAYRRAERAERMARERAEHIYVETNGILESATIKVDEAAAQIGAVTNQVTAQLNLLQSAVNSSRLALQEAAATMSALKPAGTH